MTHRDPTDVMLSVADVYADLIGTLHRPHRPPLHRPAQRRALVTRDAAGAAVPRRPAPRTASTTSTFAPCRPTRSAQVRGLYAWLGEPVGDEFEHRMRSWWDEAANEREPSTHADPAEFGIASSTRIRPLFARIRSEVRKRWTTT